MTDWVRTGIEMNDKHDLRSIGIVQNDCIVSYAGSFRKNVKKFKLFSQDNHKTQTGGKILLMSEHFENMDTILQCWF